MSFKRRIFLLSLGKEKGLILIITLFVLAILLIYGLVILNSTIDEAGLNSYQIRSTKALFIAEAGLEDIYNEIRNSPSLVINGTISGTHPLTNFADGNYQITVSPVTFTNNPLGKEYKVTALSTGKVANVTRQLKSDFIVTVYPCALDYSIYSFSNIWMRGVTGKTFYPPLNPALPPDDLSGAGRGGDVGSNKVIDFQNASVNFNNIHDTAEYLSLFGDMDPARWGNIMVAGNSATAFVQTNKTSPVNTAEALHSDCQYTHVSNIVRVSHPLSKPEIDFTAYNNANDGDTFTYTYEGTDYSIAIRVYNGNLTVSGNVVWAPDAIHIVRGNLTVSGTGSSLTITDGSLVIQGNLILGNGSQLRITHDTPGKEHRRILPGVMVYTPDPSSPNGQALGGTKYIDVGTQAEFKVQGLVYAENYFVANPQSNVEVTGAILTYGETGNGFTNWNAKAVVRYNPIVKQTIYVTLPSDNILVTRAFWRESS